MTCVSSASRMQKTCSGRLLLGDLVNDAFTAFLVQWLTYKPVVVGFDQEPVVFGEVLVGGVNILQALTLNLSNCKQLTSLNIKIILCRSFLNLF